MNPSFAKATEGAACLFNDRGQRVIAVGAPGSRERVKCEYPQLVEELTALRLRGQSTETCMRHIRTAGVRGMLEYEALLAAAGYEPTEAARQGRCFGAMQR